MHLYESTIVSDCLFFLCCVCACVVCVFTTNSVVERRKWRKYDVCGISFVATAKFLQTKNYIAHKKTKVKKEIFFFKKKFL